MLLISKIKQLVQGLLNYVRTDSNSLPETQTFLYQMFWGVKDGSFDFYQQARSLFLRGNESPRKISVLFEYPKDKAHFPCIVIREPKKVGKFNPFGGVGVDETFGVEKYTREGFTNITSSSVDIMCISDNFLESILIAEVLYALLEGGRNTLESEFTNFDFSLNEIIAENQLFPTPIIIKNISITVEEENRYSSLLMGDYIHKFIFDAPEVMCPYECQGGDDPDEPVEIVSYFEFAYPYVWLDKKTNTGEQKILSNTDWKLEIGETEIGFDLPPYQWGEGSEKH